MPACNSCSSCFEGLFSRKKEEKRLLDETIARDPEGRRRLDQSAYCSAMQQAGERLGSDDAVPCSSMQTAGELLSVPASPEQVQGGAAIAPPSSTSASQARNALRLDARRHFLDTSSPLTHQEEAWMTEEVLGIYVRARETPAERLEILVDSLLWRIAHRETLASLECTYCKTNPLSHDARLFGHDLDGDFVFMNCFALPQDISVDSVVMHMACLLDRALKESPESLDVPMDSDGHPRVRQWTYIFDLYGFGVRYYDARVPLRLLELFQVVHRGRLKKMICLDAPFGFGNFFSIVRPFLKPATREKLEFSYWERIRPSLESSFGTSLAAEIYDEAMENRDPERKALKKWTTFYGKSLLAQRAKHPICDKALGA